MMDIWLPMETAPKSGVEIYGKVNGRIRVIKWGKIPHIPFCGWLTFDRLVHKEYELCEPTAWKPRETKSPYRVSYG